MGYSERGVINALFYELAYSSDPLRLLEEFLSLAHFSAAGRISTHLTDAHVLIEQSLSDFGDADAILLLDAATTKSAVFLEAKVKSSQAGSWTIAQEFSDFEHGCQTQRKLSSSNLFTQLYHKVRFIEGLRLGGIELLQKGLPFPTPSTKPVRKIGSNPVVLSAVKEIQPYRENASYLSLVPDRPDAVRSFFDRFGSIEWPLKSVAWESSRWGGVAWEQVAAFCSTANLVNTSRVLEFNGGQIFSRAAQQAAAPGGRRHL